ncbi:MAG: molybdopterin-guanine dinucleotide biosynthesis protein B [Lachnospiraceae bacterium]
MSSLTISAAILYGGKSSRMGQEKGTLRYQTRTFLQQIAANLSQADELLLSVNDSQKNIDNEVNARRVVDIWKDCGPLGGIHALLKECQNSILFVTTVDTPLMDWKFVQELMEYMSVGIDGVVPIDEKGQVQPLCALYRKEIDSAVEQQLQKGDRKMKNLLRQLQICYVPVTRLSQGEKKLQNINTPEEYQQFLEGEQFFPGHSIFPKLSFRFKTNIPIFAVVAYSGTGKTTFLEKLIGALKARHITVAVIKHDGHDFEIDKEGTDTWRMTRAGADMTVILSQSKAAVMENRPMSLEQLLSQIHDVDLILAEGFKKEKLPKILLYRKAASQPLACPVKEAAAIVSDVAEWPQADCPCFGLDDMDGVVNWLIQTIE